MRFFGGGGKNPADAAMPYFNQIQEMEKANYNPFIQQGQSAYNTINPVYSGMAQDPAAFLESLMGQYAPSDSYRSHRDELTQGAANSAAAGGFRGTPQDMQQQSRITDSLLNDDMQQWLQNVMGIQSQGLQGQQGFYNTGFNATNALTGDLANVLATQGQLAFQGQTNKNQSKSDFLSGLAKLGAAGVGGYAGLLTGGPMGALKGAQMGSQIGKNIF